MPGRTPPTGPRGVTGRAGPPVTGAPVGRGDAGEPGAGVDGCPGCGAVGLGVAAPVGRLLPNSGGGTYGVYEGHCAANDALVINAGRIRDNDEGRRGFINSTAGRVGENLTSMMP